MAEGKGFFDIKLDYSNASKAILEKYGNQIIKKMRVSREPLSSKIQVALRLVNNKAGNIYDTLFHLSLIVTLDKRDIMIEKNEVIDLKDDFKMKSTMELMDVPLHNKQITLEELLQKTLNGMGLEKYHEYNAWTNNCQIYIDNILKFNQLLTPRLHTFIYQDLDEIIKTTPWLARKFADFVTHTAAWFNKIRGGKEPIFYDDIEHSTMENDYFRKVMYTTDDKHMQVVYMSIKPREDIGLEIHDNVDQFFRIESGKGKLTYGKNDKVENKRFLKNGEAFLIPAGIWHNVKNSSYTEPLKLYTIYSPANHPPDRKQKNKTQ